MAKPEIRAVGADDVLAIADLMERQLRRYMFRDCTPDRREVLLGAAASDTLRANLDAGFCYHVAASGTDVFGVVGIRDVSHVHQLCVADAVRGSGLGRRLWEAARDGICMHGTAPPTGPAEERRGIRSQPMRYVMLGGTPR